MARRPAVTRRGGAALERPPRRVFCSCPRDALLASSQPGINLSHPLSSPPDLPHELLSSLSVLGRCGLEFPLVSRQLIGQLPAFALKSLPFAMRCWHRVSLAFHADVLRTVFGGSPVGYWDLAGQRKSGKGLIEEELGHHGPRRQRALGAGSRRFKSSHPDHSFQALLEHARRRPQSFRRFSDGSAWPPGSESLSVQPRAALV